MARKVTAEEAVESVFEEVDEAIEDLSLEETKEFYELLISDAEARLDAVKDDLKKRGG